jgi:glycosyltransferase involved in cell wall biosynthesis
MNIPKPVISIVIPAYNEERRLPRSMERIGAYLKKRAWDGELIVVDDGSTDRTAQIVTEWQKQIPTLRLVQNGANRGKGFSVRHGMLESRAPIAIFTDADLSSPIEEADKLLGVLGGGRYDVAIGSRAVDRRLIRVHQSRIREIAGIVFNRVVQLITGLKILDTQCGFKAFVLKTMKPVFLQQRIEGFGFDPEILFLAKQHGLRIVEVPVEWAHDADSRVRMLRDSLRMMRELLQIRWNWLRGRYRGVPGQ